MKPSTFWQRLGRAARDRSFVAGTVLVLVFVTVAALGPELAPHNPFLRDRIQTIDGQLRVAPITPCDTYPLGTDREGRDLLSLLLYGARQTLIVAFVATLLRLFLGLLVGMVAGWFPDGPFDQFISHLIEMLAAIPGLVMAALVVYLVGIRRGQISFIIALSLVGWGEVTQIVRGHVLVLRRKLFILAARATGLDLWQTFSRHVLPNLMEMLLGLAALEMGAVMLLLGELGFIHVFIGGGGAYVSDAVAFGQRIHYFEIPDWGGMLGTSWQFFRSRPWLPLVPATAFFVSILGFNLFGYGLQRFIEKGRFHPSGRSLLSAVVLVALTLLGTRALLASSSIEAQYTSLARQFDVERAWEDVSYLQRLAEKRRRPELARGTGGGRQPGVSQVRRDLVVPSPVSLDSASASSDNRCGAECYIVYHYQKTELSPLGRGDYYQPYLVEVGQVTAEPSLLALGADGRSRGWFYGEITFDPLQPFEAQGAREGELVVVGNTPGAIVPEGILLSLDPHVDVRVPYRFHVSRDTVVLRVVPEENLWLDDQAPPREIYPVLYEFPNLLIGESAARRLLAMAELDLDALRGAMAQGERIRLETGLRVRVDAGLVYERVSGLNVIGYIPAADTLTYGDRIVVVVDYNGPAARWGDTEAFVDGNASGIAVMLELSRLLHDLSFMPKRTVVFAAFDEGGGRTFVNNPILRVSASSTWTAVVLQEPGAGGARLTRRELGYGLAQVFDQSAHRFGVRTGDLDAHRFFFVAGSERLGALTVDPSYAGLVVTRPGAVVPSAPTPTSAPSLILHVPAVPSADVDADLLEEAGRVIAHYVMVVSSR